MSELRRLLIASNRIRQSSDMENLVRLTTKENHYLSRVLRFSSGDQLNVVDGLGNLWDAAFVGRGLIRLGKDFAHPSQCKSKPFPLTCLAVVIPRNGFDEVLRMSCEIGVDVLQPLISDRSVVTKISKERFIRWEAILDEAFEQCERLWRPELRQSIAFSNWFSNSPKNNLITLATPRLDNTVLLERLLNDQSDNINQLWVLIGPEGGWTNKETTFAMEKGCELVHLGETILRTSTAGICATYSMLSWRRSLK